MLVDRSLDDFVLSVLGAHWPIALSGPLTALIALHLRNNISMKIVVVIAISSFFGSAMLTYIYGRKVASVLTLDFLDLHLAISFSRRVAGVVIYLIFRLIPQRDKTKTVQLSICAVRLAHQI